MDFKVSAQNARSAPDCCSETAVTPLHRLKPKHLRIFEPLHSPLHSVTFGYMKKYGVDDPWIAH